MHLSRNKIWHSDNLERFQLLKVYCNLRVNDLLSFAELSDLFYTKITITELAHPASINLIGKKIYPTEYKVSW